MKRYFNKYKPHIFKQPVKTILVSYVRKLFPKPYKGIDNQMWLGAQYVYYICNTCD